MSNQRYPEEFKVEAVKEVSRRWHAEDESRSRYE